MKINKLTEVIANHIRMKNHLFAFILCAFALGIVAQMYFSWSNNGLYLLPIILFCILIFVYKNTAIFINTLLIFFFSFGIALKFHTDNQLKTIEEPTTETAYLVSVERSFKSSEKYQKYQAKIIYPDQFSSYKILVYLPKDTVNYHPNDQLLVYGKLLPLPKKVNPYQFDYGAFLERKGISAQLFAQSSTFRKEGSGFYHAVSKSKIHLLEQLKQHQFSAESIGLIGAMLLGTHSELDQDIYQSYVNSGVVHILAISGLHVMMLFGTMMWLTKIFLKLPNGKIIRIIFCLLFIWLYAFYVELRPPVFRASLMITLFYFALLLKRKPYIFHALALSAFLILLFRPNDLFDVGFQLSFSAVFFIIWLNEITVKWVRRGSVLSQSFKGLLTTSTAAQLGTMPFASFYFNQFTWLFLFGNIVLIPAAYGLMIVGIISIFLVGVDFVPTFFVDANNFFIRQINAYIGWLASWDKLVWRNLYISPFTSFLLIVALVSVRIVFVQRSKIALIVCLFALVGNLSHRLVDIHQKDKLNELIIYQHYRESTISVKKGKNLVVFSTAYADSSQWKKFIIEPYANHQRIKNIYYFDWTTNFRFEDIRKNDQQIIVGKSTLSWQKLNQSVLHPTDYYLIRNNEEKGENLAQLSSKKIIADGSNYPNVVENIEVELIENKNEPLWQTARDGYFKLGF